MVSVYTLSGRPAVTMGQCQLSLSGQDLQGGTEFLHVERMYALRSRYTVSSAAFLPVIASMRRDTARSSPCRLSCRMASAEGGTPASAKLRRTSASSPVVEADAPVCISLASRGWPMVLPAVLLDTEACAGRAVAPAECGALSLLCSVDAAVSRCCILSAILQCFHNQTSPGAQQALEAAGNHWRG